MLNVHPVSLAIQALQRVPSDEEHVVVTEDCATCLKKRPPLDWGFDSDSGRIDDNHCRCDVVTVPFLKKVFYKTKEGADRDKQEFVDVEITPDMLWLKFSAGMPDYLDHLDKAAVQDAEHRAFSDDVPVHTIFSIVDFAENGTFDPRAEWVSRHWVGGEQYTVFPVVTSVHVDTIRDSSLSADDKERVKTHLQNLGAPPTVKEVHYFVTNDLTHDFWAVRAYLSELDKFFDQHYDAAPPKYERDSKGNIVVGADGVTPIVESCGCAPDCLCGCDGSNKCTRMHVTSSDGAGNQFKCRELHRWVSDSAHDGRRRRVWCYKAPGT